MRKEKAYRYSLQFPGKADEQTRVGELLEQLGSRKSRFLIRAVSAFMDAHPDEVARYTFARSMSTPAPVLSREDVRAMLVDLLAEHGYIVHTASVSDMLPAAHQPDNPPVDVDDMLQNLNVFFA